jgi:two-component system response regulator DevR
MTERDVNPVDPSTLGERIRVVLVVPHPIQRTYLIRFILNHRDLDVVAVAANCEMALRVCPHVQPDVVVVDSCGAEMDAQAAALDIQGRWPWVQVLVRDEAAKALGGAPLEATGFAPSLSDADRGLDVISSIRSLYAQRDGMPGWNGSGPRLRAFPDQALSRREWEVWQALKMGLSDAQISERLSINELTARLHVSNVLDRLGLASRRDALVTQRPEAPLPQKTRAAVRAPERRQFSVAALPRLREFSSRRLVTWQKSASRTS